MRDRIEAWEDEFEELEASGQLRADGRARDPFADPSRKLLRDYSSSSPHGRLRYLRLSCIVRATGAKISSEDRDLSFEAFRGRCAYCEEPATTLDHLVPVVRGGPHNWRNLVACCRSCNARKNDWKWLRWMATFDMGQREAIQRRIEDGHRAFARLKRGNEN